MATVLVTGGAGYIGAACCRQLLARGCEVEAIDNLSAGHADAVPAGAKFHRADIGDRERLSAILSARRIDAVFHFAAKALVGESVKDPGVYFDHNVARGVAMIETLRQHGIRKFVFSSTAAVYGTPETVPIPEDAPKEPINAYGESKLAFERILKWYAASYGWSVVALRYFNASGGSAEWGERHDPETHIIPLLLQTALGRRASFDILGTDYPTADGTCVRDYVHILDIIEAHLLALRKMDSPGFHAYNIGTGKGHSVKEVLQAAERVTKLKINARNAARRPGDPAVLCASPQKLIREFGWQPKHSQLETILEGAWEWEKAHAGSLIGRP